MATKEQEQTETLVQSVTKQLEDRMRELEPAVEEHAELKAFLQGRQEENNSAPAAPRSRRGGRRKGSGKRVEEMLSIVKENPGITVAEIAPKMGIKPNYLYRLSSDLKKQGRVAPEGRGLRVTETSS